MWKSSGVGCDRFLNFEKKGSPRASFDKIGGGGASGAFQRSHTAPSSNRGSKSSFWRGMSLVKLKASPSLGIIRIMGDLRVLFQLGGGPEKLF